MDEFFKHLEELEHDEMFPDDVMYHFQVALELERGEPVDPQELESIYERYKRVKAQKFQVKCLQMIKQPAQRSPEWYEMRENMLTASNIAPILGECPYGSARKVLLDKAGINKQVFTGNFSTNWGIKYEPVACKLYELRNKVTVHPFGLLAHYSNFQPQDDFTQPITFIGASPDGIRDDGIMLEIKCPTSREITGVPPQNYWVQMQIQMECCNLDLCHFLECKFSEYAEEEDFLDNLHTSDHDKGIICHRLIQGSGDNDGEYEYLFPLPKKLLDIKKWCEARKFTMNVTMTYFELNKYSCVDVPRDSEWFMANIAKLRNFWREVLAARKNPDKYLKTKKERAPPRAKKMTAAALSPPCGIDIEEQYDDNEALHDQTGQLTNAQLDALLVYTTTHEEKEEEEDNDDDMAKICLISDD